MSALGINIADIAQLVGVATALLLGIWNIRIARDKTSSTSMVERGEYMMSMNKSVTLANDRALSAEERALASEAREDALEKRITRLEESLSYRLTFDVILGSNPSVQKVEISHFPERRAESTPSKGTENERKNRRL